MSQFFQGDSATYIAASSTVVVLSSLATGLRIKARCFTKPHRPGWDDWTSFIAFPFVIVLQAVTLYQFCVQVPELQNGNVDLFALGVEVLTTMCASTYFFSISMCIVRISVLLFYARIFDKSRWFKISLWTIGALCWSLCLSQLVYYGDYYIPGIEALKARSVFTQWGSFLGPYLVTIAGVILDVLILLVPLPKLWGVQVSKTKRFNLFVVFLLGYCVAINPLIRAVVWSKIYQSGNKASWMPGFIMISTFIEPGSALICSCIPSISPLLTDTVFNPVKAFLLARLRSRREQPKRYTADLPTGGVAVYLHESTKISGTTTSTEV